MIAPWDYEPVPPVWLLCEPDGTEFASLDAATSRLARWSLPPTEGLVALMDDDDEIVLLFAADDRGGQVSGCAAAFEALARAGCDPVEVAYWEMIASGQIDDLELR